MKVCEYQIKTPFKNFKRIGLLIGEKILDPNLIWRGDFERDGFLSCKEKADRVIPDNLKDLLTFSDDPIDSLNDSYGLYLFLQKVGVDRTFEGFSFLKEIGGDITLPKIEEIPWTEDVEEISAEVGLALMTCGEGTNLDSEKAEEHLFAVNLYQKFGELVTYGDFWVTIDDLDDFPTLKLSILKNNEQVFDLTLTNYLKELREIVSSHSKKSWINPGDIFYLESSQKTVEVKPGDSLELNIPKIMNLKNSFGTPLMGKPWEI